MGKFLVIVGIIVAIAIFIFNRPVPPPISITWRESFLGKGKVMQIHNKSNSALSLTVAGSDSKDSVKSAFVIPAGCVKEVGLLEMNWDWLKGEKYTIQATGYGMPIIGRVP